jgi:hypothetical protein
LSVFRPNTVRLEGSMSEKYLEGKKHNRLVFGHKVQELEGFFHYLIKNLRKVHKKNVIRPVYDAGILKNIKNLRRILKFKHLCMVFYASAYKRRAISCFLTVGIPAIILGFSHGNFFPSATFPCAFKAGPNSHSAKQDKEPNDKPSNKSNGSGSEKPKKQKKNKQTKTTANLLKYLFPEIDKVIETGLQGPAIVVYVRVSSWVQVFDGKSLDYQEAELINTAERIGASVIYVIRDEGKSGNLE